MKMSIFGTYSNGGAYNSIVACGSYTWTNGITYTQNNYTAKDTFVNTAGCDSIVTLKLTINNSDLISKQPSDQSHFTSQDAAFDIESSGTQSLRFQWQTDLGTGCENMSNSGQYSGTQTKKLIITNVTSANNNQKFRCIENDQNCADTSDAAVLSLFGVGLNHVKQNPMFHIHPNPTSKKLNIKIESSLLGSTYTIMNALGQEIQKGILSKLNSKMDVSKLPTGSYTMLIGAARHSLLFVVE